MINDTQEQEAVVWYLIHHQLKLKKLTADVAKQREELLKKEGLFKEEIEKQFTEAIKSLFSMEICKDLQIGPENVAIVLEGFDVEGYLKC